MAPDGSILWCWIESLFVPNLGLFLSISDVRICPIYSAWIILGFFSYSIIA